MIKRALMIAAAVTVLTGCVTAKDLREAITQDTVRLDRHLAAVAALADNAMIEFSCGAPPCEFRGQGAYAMPERPSMAVPEVAATIRARNNNIVTFGVAAASQVGQTRRNRRSQIEQTKRNASDNNVTIKTIEAFQSSNDLLVGTVSEQATQIGTQEERITTLTGENEDLQGQIDELTAPAEDEEAEPVAEEVI